MLGNESASGSSYFAVLHDLALHREGASALLGMGLARGLFYNGSGDIRRSAIYVNQGTSIRPDSISIERLEGADD
jgi:hypothetical protein